MPSFIFSANSLDGLDYFIDPKKAAETYPFKFILKNYGQHPIDLNTFTLMSKTENFGTQLAQIFNLVSSLFIAENGQYSLCFGSPNGQLITVYDTPDQVNASSFETLSKYHQKNYNEITVLRIHSATQRIVKTFETSANPPNSDVFAGFEIVLQQKIIERSDIQYAHTNESISLANNALLNGVRKQPPVSITDIGLLNTVDSTKPNSSSPNSEIITTSMLDNFDSRNSSLALQKTGQLLSRTLSQRDSAQNMQKHHFSKSQPLPSLDPNNNNITSNISPPFNLDKTSSKPTIFIDAGKKFRKATEPSNGSDLSKKRKVGKHTFSVRFRNPITNERNFKKNMKLKDDAKNVA